jgi:hypothetical protein
LTFGLAALVHAGVLADGYQHREATIAETVIGAVLALGLLVGWVSPRRARAAALAVQTFALLGTMVGVFTMIIGVGPQSGLDVMIHAGFIALLVAGLTFTVRHVGHAG